MAFIPQTFSAAGSQITVTDTATSLKSLIKTADTALSDGLFDNVNYIILQAEDGDIRYSSTITPTTTVGQQLLQGQTVQLNANPSLLKLIRDGGANVKVNVEIALNY